MVKLESLKLKPYEHENPWRTMSCFSDYKQHFVAKNSMITDVEGILTIMDYKRFTLVSLL